MLVRFFVPRFFFLRYLRKIDPLFLNHQRSVHDPFIDAEDVLSQKSGKHQLQRSEDQDGEQDGGGACNEAVPVDQLQDQVHQSDDHADAAYDEAGKGGDTQPHLGVGGEAQHGCVIQGVEIVVGFACSAALLLVGEIYPFEAQLGYNAPQERGGIVQISQDLHKAFVVESEAGEVLNLLHVGHLFDHFVIAGAQEAHDGIFPAAGLDAADDAGAFFPFRHHLRDHVHGILEVGTHADGAVPGGLADTVVGGVELAEIFRIEYGTDLRVPGAKLTQ